MWGECRLVLVMRKRIKRWEGSWPCVTSVRSKCIGSRCWHMVHITCSQGVVSMTKLSTTTWSTGRTRFPASFQISPAQKILYCTCILLRTSFCSRRRLGKARWWRIRFWERSWTLLIHQSLGTDTYRISRLNCVDTLILLLYLLDTYGCVRTR